MDNTNFTTTVATHPNTQHFKNIWQGKNKYIKYFNLYIGAEWYKGCLLLIATILNYFLCIIYIIPPLTTNNIFTKISIDTLYTIIFITTTILCFLCVTGDPGVLPMNDISNKSTLFGKNNISLQTDNPPQNSITKSKRINKQYILNGRKYKMKFCNTCLIYRPLRCSHCKICNACIERYDHHCPWVGNCIGRNNYVYFYFYVLSFTIFTLISLIVNVVFGKNCMKCIKSRIQSKCDNYIKVNDDNNNEISVYVYIKESIALLLIVVHFLSFCFLAILFGFHTRYLITNETTAFRAKYENENAIFGNPFNKGIMYNIKTVLFKKYFNRKVFNDIHSLSSEQNGITDNEEPKIKKAILDTKKIQGESSQTFFIKNKDVIGAINNTNNTNQKAVPIYNKNQFNSKQSSLMNTQISQREHLFGNAQLHKKRTTSNKGLISSLTVGNFPDLEDIGSEKEKVVRNKLNFERSHYDGFNYFSNGCEYDNNSSVTSARDKSTNLISNIFFARGNYGPYSKRDNQFIQSNMIESNMVEPSVQQTKNLNSIP